MLGSRRLGFRDASIDVPVFGVPSRGVGAAGIDLARLAKGEDNPSSRNGPWSGLVDEALARGDFDCNCAERDCMSLASAWSFLV